MFMAYTYGRKRSLEVIIEEAKKYRTRTEFAKADCSMYAYAAKNNLLDIVCIHMNNQKSYSIPQYICKFLFDRLLGEASIYNSRKIISPYEIDIFYPKFNLAIEYNGTRWHSEKISEKKLEKINQNNINLLIIEQKSCPSFFENYIRHIKNDIIENLSFINKVTDMSITEDMVNKIHITWNDIPVNIDWQEIEDYVNTCESKMDLHKKNDMYYRLILKYKKTYLFEILDRKYQEHRAQIRSKKIESKIQYIKNTYKNYKDVIKDKRIYDFVKRYKLIETVKKLFNYLE